MPPAKTATADTATVPIEKIDSATRAPEPLEKMQAEGNARELARASGSNPGLPFLPPGDVPGQIPDPNFPSPPPYFNIYSFTVWLNSPVQNDPTLPPDSAAQPSLRVGMAASYSGEIVRIASATAQGAYEALMADPRYGANIFKFIGPCCSFVGADATLSTAAEVEPVSGKGGQQPKPLQGEQSSSKSGSTTTPRKSHSSWD